MIKLKTINEFYEEEIGNNTEDLVEDIKFYIMYGMTEVAQFHREPKAGADGAE